MGVTTPAQWHIRLRARDFSAGGGASIGSKAGAANQQSLGVSYLAQCIRILEACPHLSHKVRNHRCCTAALRTRS